MASPARALDLEPALAVAPPLARRVSRRRSGAAWRVVTCLVGLWAALSRPGVADAASWQELATLHTLGLSSAELADVVRLEGADSPLDPPALAMLDLSGLADSTVSTLSGALTYRSRSEPEQRALALATAATAVHRAERALHQAQRRLRAAHQQARNEVAQRVRVGTLVRALRRTAKGRSWRQAARRWLRLRRAARRLPDPALARAAASLGHARALRRGGLRLSALHGLRAAIALGPGDAGEDPMRAQVFARALRLRRELRRRLLWPAVAQRALRRHLDSALALQAARPSRAARQLVDTLRYLLGRGGARAELRRVRAGSADFARAQLLLGTHAAGESRYRSAERRLRAAVQASQRDDEPAVTDLAWLQLARVAYLNHHVDVALLYYGRMRRLTPLWRRVQLERALAVLNQVDANGALGWVYDLRDPLFGHAPGGDVALLELSALDALCQTDLTLRVARRTRAAIDRRANLFLAFTLEPSGAYARWLRAVNGRQWQGARRTLLVPLRDRAFAEAVSTDREARRELRQLRRFAQRGRPAPGVDLQAVADAAARARRAAGRRLQGIARHELARAEERMSRVDQLTLDAAQAQFCCFCGAGDAERRWAAPPKPARPLFAKRSWPAEAERWRDELGHHRAQLASRCRR